VWHSSVAHGDQDSERLVGGGLDMQVFQTLGKKNDVNLTLSTIL
jgi:hypothetical protein